MPTRLSSTPSPLHRSMLERAAQFYRDQLKRSPRAIAYLKRRGLTGDLAVRYALGYAPSASQGLREAFPGYELPALVECGLVVVNDAGRRFDRFRDRIMFPIHDPDGHLVGFGGRVIDAGAPKYLNSPESPLFRKGDLLYGLHLATAPIQDAGLALAVEGYLDVVALAQFGIDNAVATLGTATTSAHVAQLLAETPRVVFCFDGDDAGRRAAFRALDACFDLLADPGAVSFVFLPAGHDPDSYVREHGAEAFRALVSRAASPLDFLWPSLTAGRDLTSVEGRAALVHYAIPWLRRAAAPAVRDPLAAAVAEASGFTVAEVVGFCDLDAA